MFKYIITILTTICVTLVMLFTAVAAFFNFDVNSVSNALSVIGVMKFVETKYVNEVDPKALTQSAISGMINSLDDQHSMYLDEGNYSRLRSHTAGNFGGIGIVMSFPESGKVMVSSVLDEGPAKEAGLQDGDFIIAVDGVSVSEYQPDEVAIHIRGEEGTDVTLTIRREGEEDKDYTITRSTIPLKTAAGSIIDGHDGIGYIRIASFSENTPEEFKKAYTELEENGMKGLIIDLRSNPGGLVNSCVDIANMVVPAGEVVSVVNKDGEKDVYTSDLKENKYPIAVLIDENSASASEILAGALQDTGAATLIGQKSYGKGSVQMVLPLLAGDAVKMTIAKYYTPSGRSIDGIGIEPDIPVELEADQDTQLEKAIEILEQKF